MIRVRVASIPEKRRATILDWAKAAGMYESRGVICINGAAALDYVSHTLGAYVETEEEALDFLRRLIERRPLRPEKLDAGPVEPATRAPFNWTEACFSDFGSKLNLGCMRRGIDRTSMNSIDSQSVSRVEPEKDTVSLDELSELTGQSFPKLKRCLEKLGLSAPISKSMIDERFWNVLCAMLQ